MNKKSKILITGGEGFIGNYLFELLEDDYNLFSYDLEFGDDIRDKFKLDRLFDKERFDVVIHLAARAGVRTGEDFPDEFISTNINGTKNIIDCCEKYGVKQLISFSSSSVLGGNYIEDRSLDSYPLEENDRYNPKSIYAMTKVAGEIMVKNSKLNWTIIRPFTVYGENGRKDMVIYKWINQIKRGEPITFYGEGGTRRGYTYVKDLVDGVKRCILNKKAYKEIIHLGGNEVITLLELKSIFAVYCYENISKTKLFKVNKMDMPNADVFESWTNSDKAKELLGWEPKPNFKKYLTNILKKEL